MRILFRMGCCGSKDEEERDPHPLIVDVQLVIEDAVWSMFLDSHTWWQRRRLRRKDYEIEVPMNYYSFDKTNQELITKNSTGLGTKKKGSVKGKKSDLLAGKQMSSTQGLTSPEHIGLETEFRNNTGEKQTYTFRFEKTRRAAINVSYQKGYSIGAKTNFTIGLPKILADGQLGAEFDMHVEVTRSTEQTFEETLTTEATSDITVAPNSHYTATVVMEERNLRADFKVWITMSMPAKEARAFIKNSYGDTVFYYKLNNLSHLFPRNKIRIPTPEGQPQKYREDAVEFLVEGIVNGMQLSSHRINLDSRDIVAGDVAGPGASAAAIKM